VNLDAALQEAKIGALPPLPEVSRFEPAAPVQPEQAAIAKAAQLLSSAKNPAMLMGRVSRSVETTRLAERFISAIKGYRRNRKILSGHETASAVAD